MVGTLVTCRLCKRRPASPSDLCKYHLDAKVNIESAYKAWEAAYGDVAWETYLRDILRNPETGQWAKEVAAMLSRDGHWETTGTQ